MQIKLLVSNPDPETNSLVFIDDDLYVCQNFAAWEIYQKNQRGLTERIMKLLSRLNKAEVTEAIAFTRSDWHPAETIEGLLTVGAVRLLYKNSGWFAPTQDSEVSTRIRKISILIAWALLPIEERFKHDIFEKDRRCVLCKKQQYGVWTGQITGGVILPGSPSTGPKNLYNFPDHCLNPDCISHTLGKMIDPRYQIPKSPEAPEATTGEDDTGLDKALRRFLKETGQDGY